MTRLSGHCRCGWGRGGHCRGVKIRVNVWNVLRDKNGRYGEVTVVRRWLLGMARRNLVSRVLPGSKMRDPGNKVGFDGVAK